MTQQYACIYPVHAAKSDWRCWGERACRLQLFTERHWDRSNVQYNVWPEEYTRKLLCPICWNVELILVSSSFCLPCGILATGWNTVQSICFSSDAVIASLLCLHDAKISHPLYLTLTAWMSGKSRRRWWTCYNTITWMNTSGSCAFLCRLHRCVHLASNLVVHVAVCDK